MKSAVIVANGLSSRFGDDKLQKKVFDRSVVQRAVDVFRGIADEIIVVGNVEIADVKTVVGGKTRAQSVANGLKAVDKRCSLVAIHDAARPFTDRNLVRKLFDEAETFKSAVPCLPVFDTLWQQSDKLARCDREHFFTVQTPQVFEFGKIIDAFKRADGVYTDESTLYFNVYGNVHFVEGQYSNKKITVPDDLPKFRVGNGFDVHPFEDGTEFILGGVHVPYNKRLQGHSDADVLAHAVCDAVLSACGERDIGVQFPDTDSRFLGADSLKLLNRCVELAKLHGFSVENVSATVICQQPKLAQYIPQMSENLAKVLDVSADCVGISATTTEHLGALGNGDGIAALATVLLAAKM